MSFLIEDILKILFFFPCVFIIATVKNFILWVGTYRNRIDKLGKTIWFQFSTKILQITILDINDWDRINVNIQKTLYL